MNLSHNISMPNSESICPSLTPLAETLRAHVAEYKKTLALFEEKGTKELAEKLAGIETDIKTTEKNINDALGPLGHSLDTPPSEPLTPKEVNRLLQEAGSKAELYQRFENGIAHVDIDPIIMETFTSAIDAFQKADNGSKSSYWEEWANAPWTPPAVPFDAVILSYNGDPETRESSDAIVKDADNAGFRPATFPEMMALGIQYPEFAKQSNCYFVGLTEYKLDDNSVVPSLWLNRGTRGLAGRLWTVEWGAEARFVFVRKSTEPKS
jgi:hypothetical protein